MASARFDIDKPDDVSATMRITMTVREWKQLKDQLNEIPAQSSSHPRIWLVGAIRDVIMKAEKTLYTDDKAGA